MLNLILMKSAQKQNSAGDLSDIAKTYEPIRIADRVTMEQPGGSMVVEKNGNYGGPYFDVVLDPAKDKYFEVLVLALSEQDLQTIEAMIKAWREAPGEGG